jgi:lipopolysaccharide/colanic/teichoic acid biosynthesis glycosyltransferase
LGLFTLPLLGLVALAIWLESRGPVFRNRVRLLPDGRRIFLVSFHTAAPNSAALRWESGFETRVGSFLRRTRIEHLPQLVNVIRGEMTLVGRDGLPPFVLD